MLMMLSDSHPKDEELSALHCYWEQLQHFHAVYKTRRVLLKKNVAEEMHEVVSQKSCELPVHSFF